MMAKARSTQTARPATIISIMIIAVAFPRSLIFEALMFENTLKANNTISSTHTTVTSFIILSILYGVPFSRTTLTISSLAITFFMSFSIVFFFLIYSKALSLPTQQRAATHTKLHATALVILYTLLRKSLIFSDLPPPPYWVDIQVLTDVVHIYSHILFS